MHKIFFITLTASLITAAGAASAKINCKADFSSLKRGSSGIISINDETLPSVSGFFLLNNDRHEFSAASAQTYDVRPDFPTRDFDDLNSGEKRVSLLTMYLSAPDTKAALHAQRPIEVEDIEKVKIYDLFEDPRSRMGGVTLIDYLDARGESLGKFFQAIALSACR